MEAGLLWWRYLDDVYLRLGLIYSFVYYSDYDFYSHWWDKLMVCNYIHSDFYSFVANGPYNYCIEF